MSLRQPHLAAAARAILAGRDRSLAWPIDPVLGDGFSGESLVAMLQHLARARGGDPDCCYAEIGVFRGMTLLSVAKAAPALPCLGIDNFAYFDPRGENLAVVEERRAKLRADNVILVNQDYEDALAGLEPELGGRKIAVLFVDGPHDYRSQLMCLQLALPHLHERAVIVVDDSNYRHVRQANRDFLVTHPRFKLLFEAYTRCHPANMDPAARAAAKAGWWNGVNVLASDPEGELGAALPPTERSREVFENEHVLHASRVAKVLPRVERWASAVDRAAPLEVAKRTVELRAALRQGKEERRRLFPSMNTYSEDLPPFRLHASAR